MSKPLTFEELPEGANFISFPEDGDDSGHGGYRNEFNLFTKLRKSRGKKEENAVRCNDGTLVQWTPRQKVLHIST